MVNSEDFAKRLQKVMDFYGLSSSALADKIDFNRSSISHLLSGRNKPSLEFVMKVLENFPEVKLYWLLNGKGNFPEEHSPAVSTFDFPEKNPDEPVSNQKVTTSDSSTLSDEIERIVIFYKNGSFKVYESR